MRPARLVLLGASALLCVAVLFAYGVLRTRPSDAQEESPVALAAESPDALGPVADFELVERSGRRVTRADLAGRPWIGGFVFTRCTGPCPKVTATMRALQDRLAGTEARLVSFTVDALFDSPEVLRAYADGVGADPERWWMLTGDQAAVDAVLPRILPGTQRTSDPSIPVGESIGHSTRLMVVDGQGRIRGLYSGETTEHVERILERVRFLEREAGTAR
jgi:cytochrome oxidase Cu insertion factor (SCO1/SenC/PrrC family)